SPPSYEQLHRLIGDEGDGDGPPGLEELPAPLPIKRRARGADPHPQRAVLSELRERGDRALNRPRVPARTHRAQQPGVDRDERRYAPWNPTRCSPWSRPT